jgi:hypothetical protein
MIVFTRGRLVLSGKQLSTGMRVQSGAGAPDTVAHTGEGHNAQCSWGSCPSVAPADAASVTLGQWCSRAPHKDICTKGLGLVASG